MDISAPHPSPHNREPSTLLGYAAVLPLVAASTIAGHLVASQWGSGPVVLLYIPAVLATAIYCGFGPALVAGVGSTLAYNYFFTVPYHTFRIDSPADIVTTLVLLIVAVVTSRLVALMRLQARLATAHASRNATIAGFARRLLSSATETDIAEVTVAELSRLFGCNAAFLIGEGADAPRLAAIEPPSLRLMPADLAAAAAALDSGAPAGRGVRNVGTADWLFHPVRSSSSVIAGIGLARDDGTPPIPERQSELFGNLLDQVALALERARLDSEARQLVALRERDKLRYALLSSIGEDVKPRLNAIASAARTLKRAGAADKAVVSGIAAEAAMLDRYVDNLVDVRPGEDPRPVEAGDVTVDLFRRRVIRDGAPVKLSPKEYAVLAELAKHAGRVLTHGHILRAVWGPAQEHQMDYLRVAIRALRQKLEADPAHPSLIVNEPAVGYRLAT